MKFQWSLDFTHWMVGVSVGDRYNTCFSIGPLVLWVVNKRKMERDIALEVYKKMGGELK